MSETNELEELGSLLVRATAILERIEPTPTNMKALEGVIARAFPGELPKGLDRWQKAAMKIFLGF